MLGAFRDYPYLHTVVQARAESASRFSPLVYKVKKAGTRVHHLDVPHLRGRERTAHIEELVKSGVLELQLDSDLGALLRRPSLRMSGPDFWELTSKHEDLVGEWLWVKGARARGRPTRLHLYVPTWLQRWPEPGDSNEVFTIQTPASKVLAPAADVVWRRRHDPEDPYGRRGVGTAYVLRDELALDELLAVMARARAANKNFPEVLIGLLAQAGVVGAKAPGQAEVAIVQKMLEQNHAGPENTGRAHILSGDFKAQPLGHTLVESQYMDTRRFGRDTSMQVFRMPPEIAGVLDNANRSTIDVARDLFESTATVPKFDRWTSAIQDDVAPDFGDDLVVSYRSPVPADRDYRAGFFKALPAAMTINEIRAEAGLSPRLDGDELYKAPGAVPVAGSPSSPTEEPTKPKKKEPA